MRDKHYASWVKGVFSVLVTDEENTNQNFHESSLYRFFSREDSKYKLKTLYAIAQAGSDDNLESPSLELHAIDFLQTLLCEIENPYIRRPSIRNKDLSRALDQFKKSTNKLFDTLNYKHSSHAFDLIEGAPALWVKKPTADMDEHEKQLSESLGIFWEKTAHRVLLEYADRIGDIGTGDPYFLVNNREATDSQRKIRLAIYLIIAKVGLNNIKNIDNLPALITHLMIIQSPKYENLERSDVNRLINTAIEICHIYGPPITMEY